MKDFLDFKTNWEKEVFFVLSIFQMGFDELSSKSTAITGISKKALSTKPVAKKPLKPSKSIGIPPPLKEDKP